MKSKFSNKLIILFVIIVLMIGVAFYLLNKQDKENSLKISQENSQTINVQTIESKKRKIDSLMTDINSIFDQSGFDAFTKNLRVYINLPIDTGRVGNTHPFGTYQLKD